MTTTLPLLLSLAVLSGGAPCDPDLTAEGRCAGNRRVDWCEDGVQHTLECTHGAVCAWNDGIASFDCVQVPCNRDLDADGKDDAIPPTGRCIGARVLWCDGGTIHELVCTEQSSCGWNEKLGAHDCVPDAPYPTPDEDADASATDTGKDDSDAGMIPSSSGDTAISPVTHLDASDATTEEQVAAPTNSAGCSSGGAPRPGLGFGLLGSLLAVVATLRRRSSRLG